MFCCPDEESLLEAAGGSVVTSLATSSEAAQRSGSSRSASLIGPWVREVKVVPIGRARSAQVNVRLSGCSSLAISLRKWASVSFEPTGRTLAELRNLMGTYGRPTSNLPSGSRVIHLPELPLSHPNASLSQFSAHDGTRYDVGVPASTPPRQVLVHVEL